MVLYDRSRTLSVKAYLSPMFFVSRCLGDQPDLTTYLRQLAHRWSVMSISLSRQPDVEDGEKQWARVYRMTAAGFVSRLRPKSDEVLGVV